MAETMQSLDQLAALKPAAPEAPKYVQKLDNLGRAYATGKRKNAVARVWIKRGTGKITVNNREIEVFFARPVLRMMISQPLVMSNRNGQYDVICRVSGGGLSGHRPGPAARRPRHKRERPAWPAAGGALASGGLPARPPGCGPQQARQRQEAEPLDDVAAVPPASMGIRPARSSAGTVVPGSLHAALPATRPTSPARRSPVPG